MLNIFRIMLNTHLHEKNLLFYVKIFILTYFINDKSLRVCVILCNLGIYYFNELNWLYKIIDLIRRIIHF